MRERRDTDLHDLQYEPAPNGCPKNDEGKRIFPGKKTYNDSSAGDRKKVYIKATVNPIAAGVDVHFSWWDVDDPCSSIAPLDDNDSGGTPTGGDNSGTGATLSAPNDTTDFNGEATVTFTVTMQPGDNFKIAASCYEDKLNEMTQAKADGQSSLPDYVKMSEMLTVWRKLHIELDSMEEVGNANSGAEDNWVRGGVDTGSYSYDEENDETTIMLLQDLAACWEEGKQYHFENGEYKQCGQSWTPLRTIGNSGYDKIVVDGNAIMGWPCFYDLKDDDDVGLLPSLPDISKCDDIFEDCYIDCVSDARGSTQDLAFERNLGGATTDGSEVAAAAERGSAPDEADDWWVVYVTSGYQAGYSQDNDPDSEISVQGAGDDDYQASAVFLEDIRNHANTFGFSAATLEQQTVVHEIGHQVLEEGSSAHTPNTIMNEALPVYPWEEKFSNPHIATIRDKTSSPG